MNSPNPVTLNSSVSPHLAAVPTPGKVTYLARRQRAVDLANLTDVRREMSRVYREVHRGRLDANEGGKRVYMLSSIAKVVELAEVQPRVEAIERALRSQARAE